MTTTQAAVKLATEADPLAEAQLDHKVADAPEPISAKVLEKIRLRRRKVADLHGAVLARVAEARSLREHLGGLKIEIATLKDSWELRDAQREVRNTYLFPRDPEARDHPAPARGSEKTPKAVLELAQLEHDLETAAAELKIAEAAQTAASERWSIEKTGLDAWERAARSSGPAARAFLDSLPAARSGTAPALTGQTDFRDGIPGHSSPLIR